jgi:peroxiredoxin
MELEDTEMSDTTADRAPDFVLTDTEAREVRLTDLLRDRLVVLVFNRGFT